MKRGRVVPEGVMMIGERRLGMSVMENIYFTTGPTWTSVLWMA